MDQRSELTCGEFDWLLLLKLRSMRSCTARARSCDNYSVMNRIMLRFRPIAPKPVNGDAASGTAEEVKVNGGASVKRAKRKYVRVRGKQSSKHEYRSSVRKVLEGENSGSGTNQESSPGKVTVTLQLLPERSDYCSTDSENKIEAESWKTSSSFSSSCKATRADPPSPRSVGVGSSVMETLVIVEGVTDTYIDSSGSAGSVGLGFSDKERISSLQLDTCPAFVSDGEHNVVWVNDAYKRMVAAGGRGDDPKGFLVWLVVKAELPQFCPSFACRVRLIQRKGEGQKWNRIVACDVWRMMQFAAGFAWKLDVHTALGLGI